MFVLNFLGFVGLYLLVGQNNAFKPRSYLASNRWIAMTFVMIFVTAIVASLICAVIAKGGRAPLALAVVVLVLGLLLAIPSVIKHQRNANLVRVGDVSSAEAARLAHWPVWVPFAFPVVGAIGSFDRRESQTPRLRYQKPDRKRGLVDESCPPSRSGF
jgi:hypothetical protein